MKESRSGQGTLEYVIILAAVVAAIIVVAGMLKGKLQGPGGAYDKLTNKMQSTVTNITFD